MKRFLKKHGEKITGTISCFDRTVFKGYLSISWAKSMERFMSQNGLLIKDFKRFVLEQSQRVKQHARQMAQRAGRPYLHLTSSIRKEKQAHAIAARDGITQGLICVFAAVEGCGSFKLAYGKGRPRLVNARRKCLCLYFYFIDRELGFMHVRIQTWFPFTVQVYINGHAWLARKMDQRGIAYEQCENAFLWTDNPARAQRFADRFVKKNWPRILSALARKVNPLMTGVLKRNKYYWITEQAELATDVMFKDYASLKFLYKELAKHPTLCFSAEDVLAFLGRKLHGNFRADVLNHHKKRLPGIRIRHWIAQNGIKMYDKHGSVLRIETVINTPYAFKIRRLGKRQGELVMGWFPMSKSVANLYRYEEVALAANHRYLDALAEIEDPSQAREALRTLAKPLRKNGRSHRGFNPASDEDVRLFAAVMRGEHAIMGFRNRDIRHRLFRPSRQPRDIRRQSAKVSRLFKRLHVRRLIAKIPRSRRWRVSAKGHAIMSTVLILHHETYPKLVMQKAA